MAYSFLVFCVKIEIEISQKERENMKNIAVIVAILYIISACLLVVSAFLVSNALGIFALGILCMIPTAVLYYEAASSMERRN